MTLEVIVRNSSVPTSPRRQIYPPTHVVTVRNTILKYRKLPKLEPAADAQGYATDLARRAEAEAARLKQAQDDASVENSLLDSHLNKAPTTTDGLKKVRDITQEEKVETSALESKDVEAMKLSEGNAFTPKDTLPKGKSTKYPLRKEFSTLSKSAKDEVFTNHFEANFKPNTRFFVYEILKVPAGKSKRKAKYLFKTAYEA
jgi:eukaryotic translation initiation factor 2C